MIRKRAIYTGDMRFKQCHVFELNTENNFYEMIIDPQFRYAKEDVESDEEWLLFLVDIGNETVERIKHTIVRL